MLRINRTLSAALLALPLVALAGAPALAAPPETFSDSGTRIQADGLVLGDLTGFDGNLHYISVMAEETQSGSYAYGWLENWKCDEGVTQPWDPETGEELCKFKGYAELESTDAVVTVGAKLLNGSLNGTFSEVLDYECDDETCWPVYGESLSVDLDITSWSTKAATSRSTQTYRDPATGFSYRGTMTEKSTEGTATGTVDGVEIVDGSGRVATFTFTERVKF